MINIQLFKEITKCLTLYFRMVKLSPIIFFPRIEDKTVVINLFFIYWVLMPDLINYYNLFNVNKLFMLWNY